MANAYRVSAISGCAACGEDPPPLAPKPNQTTPVGSSTLGRSLALYVGMPLLTMVGASMAFDISLSAKANTLPGLKLGVAAIAGVGFAYLIDRGLA